MEQALCCAQVIKLSDAVQPLPRQATQFVHGAAGSFLNIGDLKAIMPEGEHLGSGTALRDGCVA